MFGWKRSMLCVGLLLNGSIVAGAAVTMPKEGSFDFNYCMAGKGETLKVSDRALGGSFDLSAGLYSTAPGGAFDQQGSRCVGTWAMVEGTYVDSGYCVTVDADGDRWLMDFKTGPVLPGETLSGKWVAIGGSGKYEGITANGEYRKVADTPAASVGGFQSCNRNTGTYKLK